METEKHPFIFYSPKAESIIPFHPYDSKNMNEERTEHWNPLQVSEKYTYTCLVCSLIEIETMRYAKEIKGKYSPSLKGCKGSSERNREAELWLSN